MSEPTDIRGNICDCISRMLDNPGPCKIYPTTKCYDELEQYIRALLRSMVPDKLPVDDSWQDDVDMRPLLQRRNGYNQAIEEITRRMGELK